MFPSSRCRRRVRPLGKAEFWERVEPFVGKDTFCQTFLIHSQNIYMQIFDVVLDLI